MLAQYLPILIFLIVSTVIGVTLVVLGSLLGPNRPDDEKLSAYECGFEAFDETRSKFDVRYYLVAILFIIFDLEITFFLPWALALDSLGMFGVAAMFVFVVELVIGYFVIWKKGALEWE
jgi:NADH-quinone oxidoreductase subunit A